MYPFRARLTRLSLLLLASMTLPARVDGPDPGRDRSPEVSPRLMLRTGAFDPREKRPETAFMRGVPLALLQNPKGRGLFIVQFKTSASEVLQKELVRQGAIVRAPLPEQAVIVEMNEAARLRVETLSDVRWIGDYHPFYRMDEPVRQSMLAGVRTSARYGLLTFEAEQRKDLARRIEQLGGRVVGASGQTDGRVLVAELTGPQLAEAMQCLEVAYAEPASDPVSYVDIARQISGAVHLETVANYLGQGVRGNVQDDGIQTAHNDFQARPPMLQGLYGSASPEWHGTATFGIVFGDGAANAKYKGILSQGQGIFSCYRNLESSTRLAMAQELVDPAKAYRAVFQSNSWGYGIIKDRAYTAETANLDDTIFKTDLLILNAMGNSGGSNGCEKVAFAKNVVSIGGVYHKNNPDRSAHKWAGSNILSSGDFAADGRIKPDLWHFCDAISTPSNTVPNGYTTFGGTSGATPLTAGHAGLIFQMWADGVFDGGPGKGRDVFASRPHAMTVKALMINSAYQYAFTGVDADAARRHQGWGMVDVKHLYEQAKAHGWGLPLLIDETRPITAREVHSYPVKVVPGSSLKVTMAYLDPAGLPASTIHRVNDLSLKVTSPSGTIYHGNVGLVENMWSSPGGSPNRVDTVENVFVQSPEAGTWTVQVSADEIVKDARLESPEMDADYALVATCATDTTGPDTVPPTASGSVSGSSGMISLAAAATDNVGVSRVEFWIDGRLAGADTTSPYSLSLDSKTLTDGNHTLIVKAYDAAQNLGESRPVAFTVDNSQPTDTTAPTASGSVKGTSGTLTLSATATDNVGVVRVVFMVDDKVVGTDTTAPYSLTYDSLGLSNGIHALVVQAYDAAGNVGTSASVSFTVSNGTVPSVPSGLKATAANATRIDVSWTPVSGATSYDLEVDGGVVTGVASPYAHNGLVAGSTHTYRVRAVNSTGTSAFSAPVSATTPTDGTLFTPWAPNKAYKAGDKASYQGVNYLCQQSHTSLPGWTPNVVSALWKVAPGC